MRVRVLQSFVLYIASREGLFQLVLLLVWLGCFCFMPWHSELFSHDYDNFH